MTPPSIIIVESVGPNSRHSCTVPSKHQKHQHGGHESSRSLPAFDAASIFLHPMHTLDEEDDRCNALFGRSGSSDDSREEFTGALKKSHLFCNGRGDAASAGSAPQHHAQYPHRPNRVQRGGSCPGDYYNCFDRNEHRLQLRREMTNSSLRKLYDERKDHIFELFQSSWVISDPLNDDNDDDVYVDDDDDVDEEDEDLEVNDASLGGCV